MAVINIVYTEPNVKTYKYVEISYRKAGENKTKIFNSGNFVRDWYDLNKWVAQNQETELGDEYAYAASSSVDHFITDGAPYIARYLKLDENNKPYLDSNFDFIDQGTEFFIPEEVDWTWEQLKEYANKQNS